MDIIMMSPFLKAIKTISNSLINIFRGGLDSGVIWKNSLNGLHGPSIHKIVFKFNFVSKNIIYDILIYQTMSFREAKIIEIVVSSFSYDLHVVFPCQFCVCVA